MRNRLIYFKKDADINLCILTVCYVTSLLVNMAIGYRYIQLGSFVQSGGIFIFPFSFIVSDIITEKYGIFLAKKLVFWGILSQFLFALYVGMVIRMPAPNFLHNKEVFLEIFDPYLKFSVASTVSILVGSWINIMSLSKLSEYVEGRYFALRSFVSSTLGELLVTVISMFIANYSRMTLPDLIYMSFCCFTVKTIISFIAIWPASLFAYVLEPGNKKLRYIIQEKGMHGMVEIIKIIWNSRSYLYKLEALDMNAGKVILNYRGRGSINWEFERVISKKTVLKNMSSFQTPVIGYYYGLYLQSISSSKFKKRIGLKFEGIYLEKGKINISSINRNGMITVKNDEAGVKMTQSPLSIYNNEHMLANFSPTQAFYIGYLASREKITLDLKSKHTKPKLHLVGSTG